MLLSVGIAAAIIYRSELDRPDRRLWAITFVVVHRFPKTRRFSSSLAVPELRSRAGCTTRCNFWGGLPAQASPGPSGRKTPARLLLHQSPTEGGGCACFSEFLPLVRSSECCCQIFAFSLPGRASQAAAARHAIFRRSNRKGGQNHVSWRGAPPAEAHIDLRSADPRPSTAAGPA